MIRHLIRALAALALFAAMPVAAQADRDPDAANALGVATQVRGVAQPRSPNMMVLFGDSREDAYTEDPTRRNKTARQFVNTANQILGQRIDVALDLATSGYRSDQYLTQANVNAGIATKATWPLIFGVINDIAQGYTAAQAWAGYNGSPGIKSAVTQFVAAGMRPILVLEPGSVGIAGNAAQIGEVNKYNAMVRGYAANNPAVIVFDLPTAIWDPTTAGLAFKSGYLLDGTHPGNLAGFAIGSAFAALMGPLIPARSMLPTGRAQSSANGGVSFMGNPLFGTLSGGSVGTGITASAGVPSGYAASCTTGVTATLTSAGGAVGNDVTLAVTATQAGSCRLSYDMSGENPGDVVEAVAQADVASGSTGFAGPALYLQSNRTATAYESYDNYWSAQGPGPATARTLTLHTVPFAIGTGARQWFTTYLYAYFTAAGSATVTWRQHDIRRVLLP